MINMLIHLLVFYNTEMYYTVKYIVYHTNQGVLSFFLWGRGDELNFVLLKTIVIDTNL